jgi:hypothetical protein
MFTVRPLWKIPFYILVVFKSQFSASQQTVNLVPLIDPFYEYFTDFYIAFTFPIIVLALVGIYKSVKERTNHDLLMLCWFVPMLLFLTFLAKHKEARYLFCVIPPFIYFAVRGIQLVPKYLTPLVLVLPLMLAVTEFRRFSDPVYSRPFLQTLAAEKVCWKGVYNIYPRDHRFFPQDEFMYFHHINATAMNYWEEECKIQIDAGNQIYTVVNEPPEPPKPLMINGTQISFR